MGTDLPAIVDQLGEVKNVTLGDEVAHLYLLRTTPTGNQGYFIYLIRGEDGIWRIDAM